MSLYTTEFTCHKHGKVRTASQSFSSSMLASSGFCMYMHFVAAWAREISAILIGWTQRRHAGVELERSVTSQRASTLVGAKSCSQYDVDARRNATLFPASYCEPAFTLKACLHTWTHYLDRIRINPLPLRPHCTLIVPNQIRSGSISIHFRR